MSRTDNFNRADSASSLGTPSDAGSAWVTSDTWGISGNKAYNAGANSQSSAVLESGLADADVEVTMATMGGVGSGALVARWTDANNHFIVHIESSRITIFKRSGPATFAEISASYTGAVASGDVIRMRCLGSALSVYQNGVLRTTATDTFNQAATKHGLRSDGSSSGRFEDFSVVPLGTLSAGTASVTATGLTTASVSATAPGGATSPTYQWRRKAGSGGTYANVTGATSLTLADTGLTRGTAYYYKLDQTDAGTTVATNEVSATTLTSQLVADGNSQTAGSGGTSWATQIAAILPATWKIDNLGVGGQTTQNMASDAVSQVVPLLLAGNTHNLVVAQEVMNDIYFGQTGAQAHANLKAYCDLVRGVNGSRVLAICPQPDRGDFPGTSTLPGADGPAQRATYRARVADFMALFLADWWTFCDGFHDPAGDVRLADVSNATYYASTDLVHWTTAGQGVVAGGVAGAVPMALSPNTAAGGGSRPSIGSPFIRGY